jgi:hypothetical protein
LIISMFPLAHKKEPARTIATVPKTAPKPQDPKARENQFLPSGPEDCAPSVEPGDFGKGGVEVEPENFGKGGVEVDPEDFGKGGVEVEPEDFEKGEVEVEPEDFEKGGVEVEPEDSGKGGVGVEVESEYDLELRIGGNVGRPGMGHSSLLTVRTVRW